NLPRNRAALRLEVLDADVVEKRRQPGDWLGRIVTLRRHPGIEFRDQDSGLHPRHGDVPERDVADITATVAIGLDADALVGVLETDALGMDVLCPARDLAADGKPM